MEPYKANYQNWKSIIPSFSYKNYDGYVYSSATGIAGNLDNASAIAVDHGLTEANRTSDISSTVSAWATRINNGASYLSSAKTAASSATKITTKYNDLIAAVSAAEDVYKNDQNKYTVASRNTFKTAYEAAKAQMASLDPNGDNAQYSSDSTLVGNLASALTQAQASLEYVKVTFVAYDGTVKKVLSAENDEVYIGMPALEVSSKAPTCDEAGHEAYEYCSDCDYTTYVEIAKTGHLDSDEDGKCDSCGKTSDTICDGECICHRDGIFGKIVRFIYTIFSMLLHKRITCCPDMEYLLDIGKYT